MPLIIITYFERSTIILRETITKFEFGETRKREKSIQLHNTVFALLPTVVVTQFTYSYTIIILMILIMQIKIM